METQRTLLESGILVVSVNGRMTMGSQLQSFEWMVEEVAKQHNKIVFDLSQVSYLDSSAIGVLVGAQTTVRKAGGQLRLAAPTERVDKIFRLAGIDRVLQITPTLDQAVASFE